MYVHFKSDKYPLQIPNTSNRPTTHQIRYIVLDTSMFLWIHLIVFQSDNESCEFRNVHYT